MRIQETEVRSAKTARNTLPNMINLKPVILLSLFACVKMWPRGAPNSTCVSMMPGHGKQKQSGPSPYTLSLSKETYRPCETIELTLSGSATFKGFFIKPMFPAKTISIAPSGMISPLTDNSDNIGTFTTTPEAQNNCPTSSLTHTNNNTKQSLTFTWMAPSYANDSIFFKYTVVQSKDVYWVNMESDKVEPESSSDRVKTSILTIVSSFLTWHFKRRI